MSAPPRRPAGAVVLVPGAVDGGLVGVAAGRQRRPSCATPGRSASSDICACVAAGCQSPGQPISRVEAAGHRHRGGLGDRSAAPAAARRRLGGRVADRGVRRGRPTGCRELSRSTARYSTSVPFASAETSWKTRYGALSSVPSGVHSPPPTGRQASVTWLKPPSGTATVIGERPPTTPPADGFSTCTAGASSRSASVPAARHTTADRGGTVTVRRPSASLRSDVRLGRPDLLEGPAAHLGAER